MKNRAIIFTVASNDYLIYLERFLASAAINVSTTPIHVYLINVDKEKGTYLKSLNRNAVLDFRYIAFSNLSDQRGYCANLRASIFPVLMASNEGAIIWIDVDSLIISKGDALIEYANKYDLSVDYHQDHEMLNASKRKLKRHAKGPFGTPYYGVFNSGIITTNNSDMAKNFFISYNEKVKRYPLSWYSDQEGMYLTYAEYKSKMNFHPLDDKFCSRVYSNDAIIWTAKSDIKNDENYFRLGQEYISELRQWSLDEAPIDNYSLADYSVNYSVFNKIVIRIRKTFKVLLFGKN